ncbi:MAG: sugar phosphate isomerase/epimerase [Candidatus Omnitrophica bacterium]|nr:sugar phosphate isomerase/epimerase [Candidatus Omnitrophota bacterium]
MIPEFGTSTHAIAGFGEDPKPFEQSVAEVAECGYSHLLLLCSEAGPPVDSDGRAPSSFVNLLKSDIDGLNRRVASHGLRISAVYPGFGLFELSPEGIAITVEKLKPYRELAWRLGTHTMIHPAGTSEDPKGAHENKKPHIESLAEIMDSIASDKPGEIFKMAADIHYGSSLQTLEDIRYFLDVAKVTNTGLCLNMGHMTTAKQEGWTLIEDYPDRVHVLAWKDHIPSEDPAHPVVSIELGKGITPFKKYIEVLDRTEVDAISLITFEDVPVPEKKEALKRSRDHMVGLMLKS